MFSSKNYLVKDEVLDMINKSNQSMCQRITLLEEKNVYLEQQNQQLNNNIINLQYILDDVFKKLERRITDFTDVWHPMMMSNINRIKDELVDNVKNVQQSNNNQIKEELENIIKKSQQPNNNFETKYNELESKLQLLQTKFDDTCLEDHVVVGSASSNNYMPLIVNKKLFNEYYCTDYCVYIDHKLRYGLSGNIPNIKLSSLKYFKNICTTLELSTIVNFIWLDDNYNNIYMKFIPQNNKHDEQIWFDERTIVSVESMKKLLSALDPDVKLTYNGLETYNGKPIRKYIESFY